MSDKVYEVLTNRVIEIMESGMSFPWRKTWSIGNSENVQKSLITGKPYSGMNAIMTSLQCFPSCYWLSFKQAQEKKLHLTKGSKGTPIIYWLIKDKSDGLKANGTPKVKKVFIPRYYTIFNLSQFENWESVKTPDSDKPVTAPKVVDCIEQADAVLKGYQNAPVTSYGHDRACYSPAMDKVMMPSINQFENAEEYYSTHFHEFVHSTGHEKKLARKGIIAMDGFGSKTYSFEELIAEIGASILCNHAGINSEKVLDNSAAYIINWISVLKKDVSLLPKAAFAAQKAANLILGIAPKEFKEEPENDSEISTED